MFNCSNALYWKDEFGFETGNNRIQYCTVSTVLVIIIDVRNLFFIFKQALVSYGRINDRI